MLWSGCEGPPGPRVASKPVGPWKCQGWHILRLGQGFTRKRAQNFMELDIVHHQGYDNKYWPRTNEYFTSAAASWTTAMHKSADMKNKMTITLDPVDGF